MAVTGLLENDLLKALVNIEELRNRYEKNYDKVLFQSALDELRRENKLIREAGEFRTPRRFVKLNLDQEKLAGHVFHCVKNLGVTPFSLGQLIELSAKKYPKREDNIRTLK